MTKNQRFTTPKCYNFWWFLVMKFHTSSYCCFFLTLNSVNRILFKGVFLRYLDVKKHLFHYFHYLKIQKKKPLYLRLLPHHCVLNCTPLLIVPLITHVTVHRGRLLSHPPAVPSVGSGSGGLISSSLFHTNCKNKSVKKKKKKTLVSQKKKKNKRTY